MTRSLLMFTSVVAATLSPASGLAADCPWQRDDVMIYATMTRVVVDDVEYKVRGQLNRGKFLSILMACDEPEAARHFQGWRNSRTATNISAATLFGLVYTPFAAAGSAWFKQQMILDVLGQSENRSEGITGGR